MPRTPGLIMGLALVAGTIATATITTTAPAAAAPAPTLTRVTAGHALTAGQTLTSPSGAYRAAVQANRLVVRTATGRRVWASGAGPAAAHVSVARSGQLLLASGRRAGWRANTSGSGQHAALTLSDRGVLTLAQGGAVVWSSAIGNGCAGARGRTFRVDLSRQFARACNGRQQLRAFAVTTGAVRHGDGTPTGTWHVQRKVRNTVLHPSAGGAYHVHYWVPYDGAYGLHDSPWQTFPYGSAAYRTHGSHGCTHVPGASMAWLFRWIRVGSTVRITR